MNYDDDKFDRVFLAQLAAKRGTDLHALAAEMIRLGVRLEDREKTLNMYVNDCIGFGMSPEVVLYYSPNAFVTTDALGLRANKVRIFDLKTGSLHTSERQLFVYGAYFCLEYGFKPFDLDFECRIYQNDEARVYIPDPVEISLIMEKIKNFDNRLNKLREELA